MGLRELEDRSTFEEVLFEAILFFWEIRWHLKIFINLLNNFIYASNFIIIKDNLLIYHFSNKGIGDYGSLRLDSLNLFFLTLTLSLSYVIYPLGVLFLQFDYYKYFFISFGSIINKFSVYLVRQVM